MADSQNTLLLALSRNINTNRGNEAKAVVNKMHTHLFYMAPTASDIDDVSEVSNCYVSDLCMGLPFNHIYNQYFFMVDTQKVLAELEKEGKRMSSFSAISRENAVNCEYNTEFLNEAHTSGNKVVHAAFNLMAWDSSHKRLLAKNSQIASALALLGCVARKCEVIVPHLFWAGIPGAASNYPSTMKFLSFLPEACWACVVSFFITSFFLFF